LQVYKYQSVETKKKPNFHQVFSKGYIVISRVEVVWIGD